MIRDNAKVDDVWVGEGKVTLGSSPSEELEFIEPLEMLRGRHLQNRVHNWRGKSASRAPVVTRTFRRDVLLRMNS